MYMSWRRDCSLTCVVDCLSSALCCTSAIGASFGLAFAPCAPCFPARLSAAGVLRYATQHTTTTCSERRACADCLILKTIKNASHNLLVHVPPPMYVIQWHQLHLVGLLENVFLLIVVMCGFVGMSTQSHMLCGNEHTNSNIKFVFQKYVCVYHAEACCMNTGIWAHESSFL